MMFKKLLSLFLALLTAATATVALSGCDDLGAYENESEYYSSFGAINLIEGFSRDKNEYSVEEYFYNKESRERFLVSEDRSTYKGVPISDYVYMAIPVKRDMVLDSIALYMKSDVEQTVYLSVFITSRIPSEWQGIGDPDKETVIEDGVEVEKEIEYDDPDHTSSVANAVVRLDGKKWGSFLIDEFATGGGSSKSVKVSNGQYILIQFRNNSGDRVFDEKSGALVDRITQTAIEKAEFTMTNLLVRALDSESGGEGVED